LSDSFHRRQQQFFTEADPEHFAWQTANPYLVRTEGELLRGLPIGTATRFLEVGCGEGGNLANLMRDEISRRHIGPAIYGLDLFERKVVFASRQVPSARFVCGDALRLPFADQSVDLVLCRDVLHHVDDADQAVRELRRVIKPGGSVWIIEPNGRNPLIRILALVRPHERGLLRNSTQSLRRLVTAHFPAAQIEVRQPMPIDRFILHYQFGFPGLGSLGAFTWLLDVWQAVARRIVPRAYWAYFVIIANP
jgi:SAM-dependent methyltransferase